MNEVKVGQLVYCPQISLQGMIYTPAYVFSTDDEYVYGRLLVKRKSTVRGQSCHFVTIPNRQALQTKPSLSSGQRKITVSIYVFPNPKSTEQPLRKTCKAAKKFPVQALSVQFL